MFLKLNSGVCNIFQDIPGTTQEPSSMGDIAEEARACNLTLASDILVDITGCYVGRVSSNSRGRWTRLDDLATIEWKVFIAADPRGCPATITSLYILSAA